MEWFSMLAAAVLFAAACNFDTVILAMGWAVRGVRPSPAHTLVIGGLTTLITWLSLVLGEGAAATLGRSFAGALGGLVLAGMALVYHLASLESFGVAYLTPFASCGGSGERGHVVFRQPLPWVKTRPRLIRPCCTRLATVITSMLPPERTGTTFLPLHLR